MAKKVKTAISIDADVIRRVDRIAKATKGSRSGVIEGLVRSGLENAEMTAKAFSDPVILKAMGQAFADHNVLKAMASAVHDELTDSQLDLFVDRMKGLTGSEGGPQGAPSETARPEADTAGESSKRRGSGRRGVAKRKSKG